MCPLKNDLKAEAQRLGFSLCGITSPDPPDHFRQFHDWVQAGYHAEMSYLAREDSLAKRANPRLVLPEVKTVIVLGSGYPFSTQIENQIHATHGQVSAYAWSDDYHQVVKDKANFLVEWIRECIQQPVAFKICIDSAPVLERSLAWRAGLGWIGKNGCLIHPQWGSFFFLTEIFLDVEITPDQPLSNDFCGKCQRCIDACPTHCIQPNHTIDARSCISYLTIEKRGDIPRDLRSTIGNRIFGCDVCQQVCPWNQKAQRVSPLENSSIQFKPLRITLPDAIKMTKDDFLKEFQNSPILRTKHEGFLRNCIIAMGNLKTNSFIPSLQFVIHHSNAMVRSHAAWALGQFDSQDALNILKNAFIDEPEPFVREEIEFALIKNKTSQV